MRSRTLIASLTLAFFATAIAAQNQTGYPPAMPPLPLSDIEVGSLVLYIQSLK